MLVFVVVLMVLMVLAGGVVAQEEQTEAWQLMMALEMAHEDGVLLQLGATTEGASWTLRLLSILDARRDRRAVATMVPHEQRRLVVKNRRVIPLVGPYSDTLRNMYIERGKQVALLRVEDTPDDEYEHLQLVFCRLSKHTLLSAPFAQLLSRPAKRFGFVFVPVFPELYMVVRPPGRNCPEEPPRSVDQLQAPPHCTDQGCVPLLQHAAQTMDEDAARRLLALQPKLSEAHGVLGYIVLRKHRDGVREAMRHFRQWFQLKNSSALISNVKANRLEQDVMTLRYLGERGLMDQAQLDYLVNLYEAALVDAEQKDGALSSVSAKDLRPWLNQPVYFPLTRRVSGSTLNEQLDFAALDEAYVAAKQDGVRLSVVDDLFRSEVVEAMREFALTTMTYTDLSKIAYTGCYLSQGLGNELVAQMVEDLLQHFPRMLRGLKLRNAWIYKYNPGRSTGINIHADEAIVNFNVWLSRTEANLDDTTGGLVVYTRAPPEHWEFADYNRDPTPQKLLRYLGETHFANRTVRYQQNRAIVFQSDLFHMSHSPFNFRQRHENSRINLTFLFGKRHKQER